MEKKLPPGNSPPRKITPSKLPTPQCPSRIITPQTITPGQFSPGEIPPRWLLTTGNSILQPAFCLNFLFKKIFLIENFPCFFRKRNSLSAADLRFKFRGCAFEFVVWGGFWAPKGVLGTAPEANAFRAICRLKLA